MVHSIAAPKAKTLLAPCREEPGAFANVYAAAYSEDLTDGAARLLGGGEEQRAASQTRH